MDVQRIQCSSRLSASGETTLVWTDSLFGTNSSVRRAVPLPLSAADLSGAELKLSG